MKCLACRAPVQQPGDPYCHACLALYRRMQALEFLEAVKETRP